MSINKQALVRYKTLDKCFSNMHRNYTILDLISECNEALREWNSESSVSRSQIYSDIKFMKSEQGWSILLDEELKYGRKKLFRYADKNFSINNLSNTEESIISHILMTITRMEGSNIEKMFDKNIIANLFEKFNISIESIKKNSFVVFESSNNSSISFFPDLYVSIKEKRVLKIQYRPYNGKERKLIVHPYFLKESRNSWYLHCRDTNNEIIFHLALNNIVRLDYEDNIKYIEPKKNTTEYFKDIIGNDVKPTKLTEVILKISNEYMPYLLTNPIHESQKIHQTNQHKLHTIISLTIKPNLDFFDTILSHGSNIELLSPKMLRTNLKLRLNRIINKYN